MSDEISARLGLPYLVAGQLQKHITLNEALTRLDALVQAAVVSRSTTTQPASPADGDLYILPAGASGAIWGDHDADVLLRAEFGGWTVVEPVEGAVVWIADEDQIVVRRDGGWTPLGGLIRELQAVTRIGLNTEADAANPFCARLNKALWTALGVGEAGDGDLRMTFNKEGASDVLSLLFQSGYGGRAELGLIGDDDLTLKVSADGSTWRQALSVDRLSGAVSFPAGCGRVETTVLTANATFSVPAWARRIEAVAVGAGGGGGSGAAGASGASRFGGGGGAGGVSHGAWATTGLAATLIVAIGAGGSGSAGVATGAGATGGNGGSSTIANGGVVILTGRGGGGGAGGNATSGAAGSGGAGSPPSNGGGASSVSATAGVGASLTRPDGSGGGGAGGGLDAANVVRAGGAGGQGGATVVVATGGAGGSGAVGGAGAAAPSPALSLASGGGGGGGASTTTAWSGGAGAAGGAGGGGGGAGVTASGAGGAGGGGVVRITAIG